MFRTVPLSHHHEFFTVHTAMVYVIQLASRIRTVISQIYFGIKLHVSDSSSVHHHEFFTVRTAYGFADSLLSTNQYDIYQSRVYSEKLLTMDRGTVQIM